jgi:hypothetical protein
VLGSHRQSSSANLILQQQKMQLAGDLVEDQLSAVFDLLDRILVSVRPKIFSCCRVLDSHIYAERPGIAALNTSVHDVSGSRSGRPGPIPRSPRLIYCLMQTKCPAVPMKVGYQMLGERLCK